jgi:hypothetical protein
MKVPRGAPIKKKYKKIKEKLSFREGSNLLHFFRS